MEFSLELTNEVTSEVKVISFVSENERSQFIDKLPDHINWWVFENGSLFTPVPKPRMILSAF